MPNTARILHQLLDADRLIGVEAAPRGRFPQPAAAARAPVRAAPMRAPAATPGRPPMASATPAATPPAGAAWQIELEIPLQAGASAPPAPLALLFVSIEWGPPLAGETRALFDRQVAAMKVPPASVGLIRLAWPNAQEPTPDALLQAKTQILAVLGARTPRVAVLLGGFSAKAMTGAASLTLARGRWFNLAGQNFACPACVTWHPSQLGVDRDRRMQTWEDLQKVMAKLAE